MGFLHSQESLSTLQWALRGLLGYLFLLFIAKLLGQRTISQLRLSDFIVSLVLGNIIAHPLSDEKLGMQGAIITTSVVAVLYVISTLASIKINPFRRFFEPSPVSLIINGQILNNGLATARITVETLLSELRKNKVTDIQKVASALWEPGGTISVFFKSDLEPLTPFDISLHKKPAYLQKVIIKEGQIDFSVLRETGKNEKWLKDKIYLKAKADIEKVFLATIGDEDDIHIVLKS
ncbi:MAG TPA: hypothetical protein DCZ10_07765 [Pelotomaculum sp.]|nr:hypothetical protein [Pelotomaculum sp.]